MIGNRRDFLSTLGLFLWASTSGAQNVLSQLGPAPEEYVQQYFDRFWKWYTQHYMPLAQKLSAPDQKLFQQWRASLKEWGHHPLPGLFLENFLLSHEVIGTQRHSQRWLLGQKPSPAWQKAASHWLHQHQVKVPTSPIWAVGANLETQEHKVYSYCSPQEVKDFEWLEQNKLHLSPEWAPLRIFCTTNHKGRWVKKKMMVPLKTMDWKHVPHKVPLNVTQALKIIELYPDGSQKTRWLFRLQNFFLPLINETGHPLASQHSLEFQQLVDTLIYESVDRYTLYYP